MVEENCKRRDSTIVLTMFFMIACLWTVGVAVWMRTGEVFDVKYFTQIVEVIGILGLVVVLKTTSLRIRDFGLSVRDIVPTMKRTCIRVVILLMVMSVVKLCVMRIKPDYFPAGAPFWDWAEADMRLVKYLVTAFVQELLARGGIQSSLKRAYSGRFRKDTAIFLTSLYFMTLHFQYGLAMMFGAGALSVLLGYIYKKDENIYGAVVIHYCFGKFADFLHLI